MYKKILPYSILMGLILALSSCKDRKYYAIIETDFGTMEAELYNETPIHRDNFVKLAKEGFYDDLLFHRVMSGFMIQGGDPMSRDAAPGQALGMGDPGYTLEQEIGAPHFKGALSAARQPDQVNPQKRSSGSQFFIVQGAPQQRAMLESIGQRKGIEYNQEQIKKYETLGGYPMLDMDYTVFGELTKGWDVIDKIAAVQTNPADRPLEDVKMKVRIAKR